MLNVVITLFWTSLYFAVIYHIPLTAIHIIVTLKCSEPQKLLPEHYDKISEEQDRARYTEDKKRVEEEGRKREKAAARARAAEEERKLYQQKEHDAFERDKREKEKEEAAKDKKSSDQHVSFVICLVFYDLRC